MADSENKILLSIDVDQSEVEAKVQGAASQVVAKGPSDTQYANRRARILKRRRVRQRRYEARQAGAMGAEKEQGLRAQERIAERDRKEKERLAARQAKEQEKALEKDRKEKEKAEAKVKADKDAAIKDMHATLKRFAIGLLFMQGLQVRGATIVQSTLATMASALDKMALVGVFAGGPAGWMTAIVSKLGAVFTEAAAKVMDYGKGAATGAARFSPVAMAALARRNVAELQSEIMLSRQLGPAAAAALTSEAKLLMDPQRIKAVGAVRGLGIAGFEKGIDTEREIYKEVLKVLTPEGMVKAKQAITGAFDFSKQAATAAAESGVAQGLLDVGNKILDTTNNILGVLSGKQSSITSSPQDWSFMDTFLWNAFGVEPKGKSKPSSGVKVPAAKPGQTTSAQQSAAPRIIPQAYEDEWQKMGPPDPPWVTGKDYSEPRMIFE